MATDLIINGTKLNVYVGGSSTTGTKIGYSTSCTLSINNNLRDITNKDSGGWRQQLEAQRDWEISCENFLIFTDGGSITEETIDELYTAYIHTREKMTVMFTTAVAGDREFYGEAYLTSLSIDTPNEDNSTYTATFSGIKALTEAEVPS